MSHQAKRRRSIVRPASQQPMYALAGLPQSVNRRAVEFLAARLPQALVQGVPAATHERALYPAHLVETLIRSVGEFTLRHRGSGPAQPSPASITLLYVPAPDEERLLRAFDFAVMPVALPALVALDRRFRPLRHDLEAVQEALVAAVAPAGQARQALNHVVRRLAYQSDNEAMLLPPRNFVTEETDLRPAFRSFRLGDRAWTDRLAHLGPTDLTHEDVPARVKHQQTRHVFVDDRGMAFFIAHPKAYDGPRREVESDQEPEVVMSALRSLYRLGGALPPGLHHDAQRSDGTELGGAIFDCEEKGQIRGKGDYANIYPNDFVRVKDYELME